MLLLLFFLVFGLFFSSSPFPFTPLKIHISRCFQCVFRCTTPLLFSLFSRFSKELNILFYTTRLCNLAYSGATTAYSFYRAHEPCVTLFKWMILLPAALSFFSPVFTFVCCQSDQLITLLYAFVFYCRTVAIFIVNIFAHTFLVSCFFLYKASLSKPLYQPTSAQRNCLRPFISSNIEKAFCLLTLLQFLSFDVYSIQPNSHLDHSFSSHPHFHSH